MAESTFWRNVATIIRRAPWLAYAGRRLWRIRQPRFTAGVVGVVFNHSGQILLVEHVFHPHFPWGLPGGWIDRHEDPASTIQRELREELELEVEVGPLLLAKIELEHLDLAYLCYPHSEIGSLSAELLNYAWMDAANLPRLHKFHHAAVQQALTTRTPVES